MAYYQKIIKRFWSIKQKKIEEVNQGIFKKSRAFIKKKKKGHFIDLGKYQDETPKEDVNIKFLD